MRWPILSIVTRFYSPLTLMSIHLQTPLAYEGARRNTTLDNSGYSFAAFRCTVLCEGGNITSTTVLTIDSIQEIEKKQVNANIIAALTLR